MLTEVGRAALINYNNLCSLFAASSSNFATNSYLVTDLEFLSLL